MSILPEDTQEARDTLSADLLAMGNVASLNFTQDNVCLLYTSRSGTFA